jgi:Protein of unknown function (DUF1153)
MSELPAPDTKYWTIRRKAAVVEAVRTGVISVPEACLRYNMAIEEFLSWRQAIEKHGVYGLRATRMKFYRDIENASGTKVGNGLGNSGKQGPE